jgi:patatin-related protein
VRFNGRIARSKAGYALHKDDGLCDKGRVALSHKPATLDNVNGGKKPRPWTEEVRLAMAWNGGVSLAVWMGGAAVEFDSARRAKAGAETVVEDERKFDRDVYSTLLKAFDRRLVVDIVAGASAGGLNGALLTAAMWHRKRLDPKFLRDQWLDIGNFSSLLQPGSESKPKSIMQGAVFYDGLLKMFNVLCSPKGKGGANELGGEQAEEIGVEEALLDVQVTTIEGEQRGFVDEWGHELVASEHRTPVRFRTQANFDDAEGLARAARASASFPGAFEPEEIIGGAAKLAGFADKRPRWAIDGGLLENAPISQAIDLIPLRPASGKVKRYVCYVNAAPPLRKPPIWDEKGPDLREVLGHVVNLPRNGRFIDQLIAIEEASRRGLAAAETQNLLLRMDRKDLAAAAAGLLPAYQRRRSVLSLEELLTKPQQPADPAIVATITKRLEAADLKLPWIPSGPQALAQLTNWEWGLRAAQRVLFLELDVLRELLTAASAEDAQTIYTARTKIDDAIGTLEVRRSLFTNEDAVARTTAELAERDDTANHVNALRDLVKASNEIVVGELRVGTCAFYEALHAVDTEAAQNLFELGGGSLSEELSDDALERFLSRALQIEVVRRSLADDKDIDAAQALHFAQLTPRAPARILSAEPLTYAGPNDPEQKLTGIRLGHFAGFYRRSWRANDYLWGRLDAATRIVDLIVDSERARFLATRGYPSPAGEIAAMLVPDGASDAASDLAWLAKEALEQVRKEAVDTEKNGASQVPASVNDYLKAAEIPAYGDPLRDLVIGTVARDLEAEDGGHLTRVLCARAAQHEVLQQELPVLIKESADDGKLGCFTPALQLVGTGRLQKPIEDMRTYVAPKPTLPQLLGRDLSDEATSNLAMRTIAQTALVAIAALPGVSAPLARIATPGRIPFMTIGGITARGILEQVAVFAAFVAATFYLVGRLITADPDPRVNADLGGLWSPRVWSMWISLIVIAACAVLPAWRAYSSESRWRPLKQWGFVIALAVSGGLVAIVGAINELGFAKALIASGGFAPNRWVIGGVLVAAGFGTYAIRHFGKIGRPIGVLYGKTVQRSHGTAALVMAVSAFLIVVSARHIWVGLGESLWWRGLSAWLAFASIPVAAVFIFSGRITNIIRTRKVGPPGG